MKTSLVAAGILALSVRAYTSSAQGLSPDTTQLTAATSQAAALYQASFGNNGLYNGPQYVFYTKLARSTDGNPYFETDQFRAGTIEYGSRRYENIPLLYDTRLDQLVVQHPSSTLFMSLISPQVNAFTVNGHRFAYFRGASAEEDLPAAAGFYEVLLPGRNQLLARHTKTMTKKARNNVVEYAFTGRTRYYVFTGQAYHPVSNAAGVAKVFPTHKKQLQQYAKEHKLTFQKTQRATSLAALLSYANTL